MIGHTEFAVENRTVRMNFFDQRRTEVTMPRESMFPAREEPAVILLDDGQGSEAVVLDLVDPVWIIKGVPPTGQRQGVGDKHSITVPTGRLKKTGLSRE